MNGLRWLGWGTGYLVHTARCHSWALQRMAFLYSEWEGTGARALVGLLGHPLPMCAKGADTGQWGLFMPMGEPLIPEGVKAAGMPVGFMLPPPHPMEADPPAPG